MTVFNELLKNFWKCNKQLLPGSWLLHTTAYNSNLGTSLEIQWLSPHLPVQAVLVWSLVGELRFPQASCPTLQKKQNRNNKSKIVTNSVKTLKMVHIKKKKKNLKKKRVTWTGMEGVCVCLCVCKTDSTRFENVRKWNKACAYGDISTHISHPLWAVDLLEAIACSDGFLCSLNP